MTTPLERAPHLRTEGSGRRDLASWVRLLRVRSWAHFALLPFASLSFARPVGASAPALARGVGIALLVLAFGYLLNSVSDRRMDSGAKNALGRRVVTREVRVAVWVFAGAAMLLSLTGPLVAILGTGLCVGSGVVYSVGPRLKRLPLVGTLANVTSFAPLLYVGAVDDADAGSITSLAVAFSALLVENQLLHEAADRVEDERGRVATTFRVFGKKGAAIFAALFGGVAALVPLFVSDLEPLATLFGLVFGVAFPLALWLRGDDAGLMARARVAHRFAAIVAGAFLFVLTRLPG